MAMASAVMALIVVMMSAMMEAAIVSMAATEGQAEEAWPTIVRPTVVGTRVFGSAVSPELLPVRVQFPAYELAGADVPHEANLSLGTGLDSNEFRRAFPVTNGDPKRFASGDRSYALAFDEDVVGVGRLIVDRQEPSNASLCGASRAADQDDNSQERRDLSGDGHGLGSLSIG